MDWKRDDPIFIEDVELELKRDIFYLYYFV
jgi:hypothetical protein